MTEKKTARDWMALLAKYREPSHTRSITEIAITVIPFLALWAAAYFALGVSYWLTLLICIPASAFLVRLFMILHDCAHGAFFRKKAANEWVGRVLGVLTMTPFDIWRRSHTIHHAGSGNLERRGIGDIAMLTVDEYKSRSWLGKLAYRAYRHPVTLFLLGPIYLFIIRHRWPDDVKKARWRCWVSAMGTNAGILAISLFIILVFGIKPFLLIYLPITVMGGALGIWLFYVQHQFEETFWDRDEDWSLHDAALYGSSHYDLPRPLRWLTANIGIHHVHHLYARIPFYRLSSVLREHPRLAEIRRLTIWESVKCVRLQLWDEAGRKLVSFKEARRIYKPAAAN